MLREIVMIIIGIAIIAVAIAYIWLCKETKTYLEYQEDLKKYLIV